MFLVNENVVKLTVIWALRSPVRTALRRISSSSYDIRLDIASRILLLPSPLLPIITLSPGCGDNEAYSN